MVIKVYANHHVENQRNAMGNHANKQVENQRNAKGNLTNQQVLNHREMLRVITQINTWKITRNREW